MPTLDLPSDCLRRVCEIVAKHAPDAEVWAYGSRVSGGAHAGSDLDLVVRQPSRLAEPCGVIARLRGEFDESNIPILVDVIDWARIPESFRRVIERGYVTLQQPALHT